MPLDALHDLIGRDDQAIAWWQMCLRAVLVFAIGLAFVRLAGKRVFGKWGAVDILLAVMVGSNLSRTMTGGAPFVPTLAATAVLLALHALLVKAAIWVPNIGDWVKGRPVQLVQDGQVDRDEMRRHGVGDGDLDQALRSCGHLSASSVRAAFLERNGEISVIGRAAGAGSES